MVDVQLASAATVASDSATPACGQHQVEIRPPALLIVGRLIVSPVSMALFARGSAAASAAAPRRHRGGPASR
jgi:hypothetical protein